VCHHDDRPVVPWLRPCWLVHPRGARVAAHVELHLEAIHVLEMSAAAET
jgi:hypothetical protein